MSKRSRRAAADAAAVASATATASTTRHAGARSAGGRSAAPPLTVTSVLLGQPLFVTSIGLSAFLLFTLELLSGSLVLPVFGGTPAVWTTALCFFTGVLFIGSLYAHVIVTRLGQRIGGLVHLGVAAAVVVLAFLAPTDLGALRNPQLPQAVNVLLVLALVAGAPAFLLASTSPLLSAWFAGRGRDAWWLYAASNAASLIALLAYPLVIAPWIPLSGQRLLLLFVLVLFVASLVAVVASGRITPPAVDKPSLVAAPPLARRRQLLWLVAAIIPAGLLSATTTYLATDLVSAPLLWVGPLGIYLASFVIAFSRRGRRILPITERLVPAAATLMWIPYVLPGSWPVVVLIPFLLASYAVIAIAVHGRLAIDRPDDAHLTGFYLLVSLGGVLATAFVALLAPIIFNSIYEYPVLLVTGLAVLAVLPGPGQRLSGAGLGRMVREAALRLAPYVVIGVLLAVVAYLDDPTTAFGIALVFAVGAAVILISGAPRIMTVATALAIVALVAVGWSNPLVRIRTFFGVIEIRSSDDGASRTEFSGTTLHGLQFLDQRRTEPTTYYVRSGPLGDAFKDLDARLPDGANIGVVGLGTGTVASYERPQDSMTFFEIDQGVVDLARDPRYFTYLADAPRTPSIVLGDARLSIEAQPPETFDLIVLDAFSSDAVPVHLLTREAMQAYERVLKPGGIVAFHLSNRYYELVPAVASTARSAGLDAVGLTYVPSAARTADLGARSSSWVAVGKPDDVARIKAMGWSEPFDGPVLTDDFSDILRLLRFP